MADYTLYCFAQSGNAYKVALMLELAGADWAPRFVDFFNGETRTPAYRAINVMGEVPILEFNGESLAQSGVILDVLGERLTTADLSLCGYLYFNEEFGVDWTRDFPAIAGWLDRIRAARGWQHPYQLMPGQPLPPKAGS